jgi:hypothetical protein
MPIVRFRHLATIAAAAALVCFGSTLPTPAAAFDLNGAWASDVANCSKVFAGKGNQLAFTANSDVYGSGFIVESGHIVGKSGRCRIKSLKDDGTRINLLAACASDIMFQDIQFSLKVVDANTVIRLFPGMDDIQMPFARCPAQ